MAELSDQLFITTRRRAALGQVTIVVPKSWSAQPEFQAAFNEEYSRANIVVENGTARYVLLH